MISIHALLAESDARPWPGAADAWISIHALLAESDGFYADMMALTAISIHALLAESDLAVLHVRGHHLRFLSTLSLRRATCACTAQHPERVYFYPRSPCGERRFIFKGSFVLFRFLSTLSLRRATRRHKKHLISQIISIHALLAESDQVFAVHVQATVQFLSTLSLRRATDIYCIGLNKALISIHALLAESDGSHDQKTLPQTKFLSTLSLRRATPQTTPSE